MDTASLSTQNIDFEDPEFKLKIDLGCKSFLSGPDRTNKVFHEEIEIKHFIEGNSTLVVGNQTIMAEAGDIVVINPYEFHATISLGEHIGKYNIFIVSPDFFDGGSGIGLNLRDILIGGPVRFRTLIRNDTKIQGILSDLAEEKANDGAYKKVVERGLTFELFGLLLREYTEQPDRLESYWENIKYYKVIEPALGLIRDGYSTQLNADELAAACNITKSHFCRIFKKATGITSTEYVTEYRLMIADIMLRSSKSDISGIAQKCGFRDLNYFSRCFKRVYGVSPSKKRSEPK